jgi:hypothetical protein
MSKEQYNFSSREDFVESWLSEMPAMLGDFGETFSIVEKSIKQWIAGGYNPQQITDGLYKIVGTNLIYYWFQNNNDIIVAAELEKKNQGYAVSIVGKNPTYKNAPPYATTLYQSILSDIPQSLLFSDQQLSNDGISLWKKLMSDPSNVVSVYNKEAPGQSFKTLETPSELDDYLGPYRANYRFVLSKKGLSLAETSSYFNLRRYRELSKGL